MRIAHTSEVIVNLLTSEQACLADLTGISYTRGTTVSEPYDRGNTSNQRHRHERHLFSDPDTGDPVTKAQV